MKYQLPSLLLLFVVALSACTLESKETENVKTEQTDEKSKKTSKKVTIEQVEKGIRANIEEMTREGGGYFNFRKDTIDLSLKLVRVHTEYLSVLGKNRFFACVDLATEEGNVYDVDFFMEGTAEDMHVTETDVHKLNGKPYYTWKQAEDKTWYTVPVENASNDLMGVVEGNDQFTFNYEVQLPEITGTADLWIPIALSDDYQDVEILSMETPAEKQILEDRENNNSILYLRLQPEHSNKKVAIQYRVNRREKSAYEEEGVNLDKYLTATRYTPVDDRFTTISRDVIAARDAVSELERARALYDHVIDEIRYAKDGNHGTGDANYACDSKSGNCTEFHSYFISLARSAGIPSRFAVGASIPSSRNEGGVDGYHCWAEFYADGKWWPVDISEANKYSALSTYYFGHHPANRIEFSRGRQIAPDPLPKSGPINFLAYPVFEVNGEPDLVKTTFTFSRDENS